LVVKYTFHFERKAIVTLFHRIGPDVEEARDEAAHARFPRVGGSLEVVDERVPIGHQEKTEEETIDAQ
jgi:hypothetical protein